MIAPAHSKSAHKPQVEPDVSPGVSLLGTHAMIFEAPGAFDLGSQRRIWELAATVSRWPGVREAVPGMTNLMILFAEPPREPFGLKSRLLEAWEQCLGKPIEGDLLELDIVYGGDGGPHLTEVVAATGLGIDEVVHLHSAPTYTVYALGSHAGYCYLGGLDPKLFLPRRQVPLLSIPRGSLSIAGMQTGISASAGPSGWHTIGSADIHFFDPDRKPAALLAPGDRIRFHAERIVR